MRNRNYELTITSNFAAVLPSENPDKVPISLVGAKIVSFGAGIPIDTERHGLVIDFIPRGQSKTVRLVLGFNDLGMWIVNKGVEIGDARSAK